MKDFIDRSFMKIFDPNYLFKDYQTEGTKEPLENNELFEEETKEDKLGQANARLFAATVEPDSAARMIKEEEELSQGGFMERWMIIDRMGKDQAFCESVLGEFRKL